MIKKNHHTKHQNKLSTKVCGVIYNTNNINIPKLKKVCAPINKGMCTNISRSQYPGHKTPCNIVVVNMEAVVAGSVAAVVADTLGASGV